MESSTPFDELMGMSVDVMQLTGLIRQDISDLKLHVEKLEELICFSVDQFTVRERHARKANPDVTEESKKWDFEEMRIMSSERIPRHFRAGGVLASYSVLEACLVAASKFLARREFLKKSEIENCASECKWSALEKAEAYFSKACHDVPWTQFEREKLDDLRKIRNVLIHTNGRIEGLSSGQVRHMIQIVTENIGLKFDDNTVREHWDSPADNEELFRKKIGLLENSFVVFEAKFLESQFHLVSSVLRKLDSSIVVRYHAVSTESSRPRPVK
jgi:hypothetical protein